MTSKLRNNSADFYKITAALIIVAVALFLFFPQKVRDNHAENQTASPTVPAVSPSPALALQSGEAQISAAVLMYHHVGPLPSDADDVRKGLTVSAEEFENQLKFLKDGGYTVTSLEKFDEMKEKKQIPEKLAILTFDDGYDDNFDFAFNLLKKYNATGTFFIITNKIGKTEYMSKDEVKQLADAGNGIGSHSVSHPSLEKYKGESLKNEINESKTTLEEIISKPVISFCYPAGKYNDVTVQAVKDASYKYAVTTRSSTGILDPNSSFEIPRYRISTGRNIEAMLK